MGETIQTSNNEVKVNGTGKALTYNGLRWYREDVHDRLNVCILQEQRVVRDLKDYVEYLQNLLNEAGVEWGAMYDE